MGNMSDFIDVGPEAFSDAERTTINWQGENYYTLERAREILDDRDYAAYRRHRDNPQPHDFDDEFETLYRNIQG